MADAYTLNFHQPKRKISRWFNLRTQHSSISAAIPSPRRGPAMHKNNFGPRFGVVGRVTEKTIVRTGYAVVWIEMAGITTPFTTPVFPFLQTVLQRTLDNIAPAFTLAGGPSVAPIPLTPSAGLGQGVFAVDRELGSGYVQQWNTSLQREFTSNISIEVAYAGEIRVWSSLPNSTADGRQLAEALPCCSACPSVFRRSRVRLAR